MSRSVFLLNGHCCNKHLSWGRDPTHLHAVYVGPFGKGLARRPYEPLMARHPGGAEVVSASPRSLELELAHGKRPLPDLQRASG